MSILPPTPGHRLTLASLILFCAVTVIRSLSGCASADMRPAVVASVDGAVAAVAALYEQDLRRCPREPPKAEDDCIAAARARWAPARTSILVAADAVHAAAGQP